MNAWDQVKAHLQRTLTKDAYSNWVVRTELANTDGDLLRVSVPDGATREYMELDYGTAVSAASGAG